MSKSAMQELMGFVNSLQEQAIHPRILRVKINELLEKEKEHIIEAFEQGLEFGFPTNGSNYFNKTYNQNK